MGRTCSTHVGDEEYIYIYICNILVGKYERKSPIGRHGHRWEGTIKMDLRKVGFQDVNCIELACEDGGELFVYRESKE